MNIYKLLTDRDSRRQITPTGQLIGLGAWILFAIAVLILNNLTDWRFSWASYVVFFIVSGFFMPWVTYKLFSYEARKKAIDSEVESIKKHIPAQNR